MSQAPNSSTTPADPTSNVSAWPGLIQDNSLINAQHQISNYHQFPANYFQNWFAPNIATANYSSNVSFLPPTAQFQPPSMDQQQSSRKRSASYSEEEDEEADENEPPHKTPKVHNEAEFGPAQQYNPYLLQTLSPIAHSTPRAPFSYFNPNLNTASPCQLGMLQNYNPAFAQQFPSTQLYNSYNSNTYSSPSLQSLSHTASIDNSGSVQSMGLSSDSGISGHTSGGSLQFPTSNNPNNDFNVPGRLALLNSNKKYLVTEGEINRRLGAPENMNSSLLGAMLRRAKNKNGGKKLREDLAKYNIFLPEGRRRSLEHTAFTALCEDEAIKLAKDFGEVLNDYFPTKLVLTEVALTIQRSYRQPSPSTQPFFQLLEAIENTEGDSNKQVDYIVELLFSIMNTVCLVLERDRSLVVMGKTDPKSLIGLQPLPDALQRGFWDFNLVTHNFGVSAVLAAYRSMCPQLTVQKVESPGLDSITSSN